MEQFFKELKSELGMGQYQCRGFRRVVGWVNLVVLSFCYLEWRRRRLLEKGGKKERPYWGRPGATRCAGMVRREVECADVEGLIRAAKWSRPEAAKRIAGKRI